MNLFSGKACCLIALIVLVLTEVGFGQANKSGRRRRIKKVVAVRPDSDGGDGQEPAEQPDEPQETAADGQTQPGEDGKKLARGFLDDYYAMFEDRTEKIEAADMGYSETAPSAQIIPVDPLSQQSDRRSDMDSQMAELQLQEHQLLQLLSRESELSQAQKEQLLHQLEIWQQKRTQLEAEATKATSMYSTGMVTSQAATPEPKIASSYSYMYQGRPASQQSPSSLKNELTGTRVEKSVPFLSALTKHFNSVGDESNSAVAASGADPFVTSGDGADTRLFDTYGSPSYSSSSSASGITKYFGLAGTTSQDIHLGLTFTVPFLSIPLTSINSILSGNFGDIGNLINFGDIDTTAIITAIVLGIAAIFVLPQAIYWLTGLNISPFNWARSEEDGGGAGLIALANTVDMALQEFDIDSRGCLAKTLCSAAYDDGENTSMLVKTVAKSVMGNKMLNEFIGPDKVKDLNNHKTKKSGQCGTQFKASCPWDTSGMSKIMLKLMETQGTNIAEVLLKAATSSAS